MPERIPPEVMNDCLDMAILAPSTSNLQPWQFYWVRSESMRMKMRAYCMHQPAAESAAEFIVCVARTGLWRKYSKMMIEMLEKLNLTLPKPFDIYYQKIVPLSFVLGPFNVLGILKRVVFTVVRLFVPMSLPYVNKNEIKLCAVKSTALACQNLMLTISAHGFSSCALDGYDSKRVRKMLNLPRDAYITMVIVAGRRAVGDDAYGPRMRFDRNNFIFEV